MAGRLALMFFFLSNNLSEDPVLLLVSDDTLQMEYNCIIILQKKNTSLFYKELTL